MGMSYNIANAIFGGTTPMVMTMLVVSSRNYSNLYTSDFIEIMSWSNLLNVSYMFNFLFIILIY
jgi:hypothetical protein